METSSTNNQYKTALSDSPDCVPHRGDATTFAEHVDAGEDVWKSGCSCSYPTDIEYKHVTGQFCTSCIKQDVCGIKEELHKVIHNVNNELDRINVFAEGMVNCKKYYPDVEHQVHCDYDYSRASSDSSRASTVMLGGMRNEFQRGEGL